MRRIQRMLGILFALGIVMSAVRIGPTPSAGKVAASVEPMRLKQAIEDRNGNAMRHFNEALMKTLSRSNALGHPATARIVHFGDSHTAADILTAVVRRNLQAVFGDAGTGFIVPGFPYPWFSRRGVRHGASGGWRTQGFPDSKLPGDGYFGLAGVALSTDKPDERLWVTASCRSFDLYLFRHPQAGAVDVFLDGKPVKRNLSLREMPGLEALTVEAENDGTHTLEVRTLGSGEVRVFGVAPENGQRGVVYDALGINGARAWRQLTWNPEVFAYVLRRRNPDLIVVSYGSNEVSDPDLDLTHYQDDFEFMLSRLRHASPNASLLVIAPPDRAVRVGNRWATHPMMPGLVEAQRRAASKVGAAFWNWYEAMGGAGSINRWSVLPEPLAQADRVHLSRAGYELVGESLGAELMRPVAPTIWSEWKAAWLRVLSN